MLSDLRICFFGRPAGTTDGFLTKPPIGEPLLRLMANEGRLEAAEDGSDDRFSSTGDSVMVSHKLVVEEQVRPGRPLPN